MTSQDQDTLETLIDAYGLFSVLDTLSGICGHKAEHVLSAWQDTNLEREWTEAEAAIDSAASKVLDLNLPNPGGEHAKTQTKTKTA